MVSRVYLYTRQCTPGEERVNLGLPNSPGTRKKNPYVRTFFLRLKPMARQNSTCTRIYARSGKYSCTLASRCQSCWAEYQLRAYGNEVPLKSIIKLRHALKLRAFDGLVVYLLKLNYWFINITNIDILKSTFYTE